MKLPMLKHDKANHLIYGLVIFSVAHLILGLIPAIIACVVAAFGKEIHDYFNQHKNTPDIYDALFTIAGGLIAYLIMLIN
jgi:hypothetical protein